MKRKSGVHMGWILLLLVAMNSCQVYKDYEPPEMESPESFQQGFATDSAIANIPWWELFQDSVLVQMIDTAIVNNRNMQIAVSRMREAGLQIEMAKADYYPLIGYNAYGSSTANSETDGLNNQVGGGLNVSYTVDLWQKIKTMNKIALQNYLASEEAYYTMHLTIVASVAEAYISLRDVDNQMIIAEKTAENFEKNLDVMEARYKGGFINEVDLTQAKIQVSEARTTLQILDRARGQIENAISVLLGTAPEPIPRGLVLYDQINLPQIPVGLPSELLRRRPDLREAERLLHAQTLRIGVAEALKYPSLTLSLDMGTQLVNPSFLFADLGAQLLGPIFNAGKLQRNVEVEETRTQQLLLNYENTYLNALREVEDAMIAVETFRREFVLRNEQMEMATKAAELSWVRYDGGMTSYLEVLSLQSSQFNAELKASDAFRQELTSIIDLYAALGGGWNVLQIPEEDNN